MQEKQEQAPESPPVGPESQPSAGIGSDHELPPEDSHARRSVWARVLIWLLVLAALALLFWWVLHPRAMRAPPTEHAVSVTVAEARKGDIGVYLNAIGTVTPVYTATITSQVTGVLTAVRYTQGQIVHRGDPLIDIDDRQYRALLLQAQGTLERDFHILAQALMDEQRYRQAWARNGIARQTLEDQEKVVLQDQGTVKLDRGAVEYAQVQVAFCHLTAPISGRVGLRLIDPGNVVQANSTTPLVVIAQIQPITVVFTIAEVNIAAVADQMRRGATLKVIAVNRTDETTLATGTLQTMDNQIDTTTGTVKLRAIFANADNALFPNQFVNTRLLVKTLHGVTLVPTSAIQQNGNESFVFRIQNGRAYQHDIKPGVAESGETAVEGISPGDVVANSSFQKLQNGVEVTVVETPPPAAKAGGEGP